MQKIGTSLNEKDIKYETLDDSALVELIRKYGAQSPIAIAALKELVFRNETLRRELHQMIEREHQIEK